MQIGLRLMVMGTVILVVASFVLFIVTGNAPGFKNQTGQRVSESQCEVYKTKGNCLDHPECHEYCYASGGSTTNNCVSNDGACMSSCPSDWSEESGLSSSCGGSKKCCKPDNGNLRINP